MSTEPETVIEINGLQKPYGKRVALDSVDLSILRNLNFNLYSITVYNMELDQPEILFDYGHILIITIFALVLGTVASTSKKTQSVQSENPQGRSLRHPGMPICVLSKIARY